MPIHADVTYDTKRNVWIVDAEFTAPTKGHVLVVPQGFETDLASIPRAFWNIIAPYELSLPAPIVHDWLYRHGGQIVDRCVAGDCSATFTRAAADGFLLDLMQQEGVAWWRRQAAYYAVRTFGGKCWTKSSASTSETQPGR